jgi:hypothetical protein
MVFKRVGRQFGTCMAAKKERRRIEGYESCAAIGRRN